MKLIEECTVGIAGLGLMGGAFAMALRKNCGVSQSRLLACDIDGGVLLQAEKAALVSGGWTERNAGEMLAACDLVFLCLCPAALLGFLEKWENSFKPGALITDIAGIKGCVVKAAEKFRSDVDFIPGHPMAGAEKDGFANAALCDFRGKNYILTPLERNKPENLAFLKNLIRRMGFGRITETSAPDHVRKIAFTSQLCHVLAAALIDCEADTAITRFGGGSFEDFTRIAMINAPMWTELFITNRRALLEYISRFENSLGEIKALIQGRDAGELERCLAGVRGKRMALDSRETGDAV